MGTKHPKQRLGREDLHGLMGTYLEIKCGLLLAGGRGPVSGAPDVEKWVVLSRKKGGVWCYVLFEVKRLKWMNRQGLVIRAC